MGHLGDNSIKWIIHWPVYRGNIVCKKKSRTKTVMCLTTTIASCVARCWTIASSAHKILRTLGIVAAKSLTMFTRF